MIKRYPVKIGQKGFTLVELMAVISIMAILAVVAYPSYNSLQKHQKLYGAAQKLVADIRYAQQIARDQNRNCSVVVQSGSYSIDGRVENFPPGVTSGGYSFSYNYFGVPSSAGTFPVTNGAETFYLEVFASGRVAFSDASVALVTVSGVSVSPKPLNLIAGDPAVTLTATVDPANATSVTWTSSDPGVATVSANGSTSLVTPKAQGTTTITVTTVVGGETDTCTVNVSSPVIHVTGVSLNQSNMTMNVGGTGSLTATIAPDDATNQNVSWVSDNPAVATVSGSGLSATVTAVAEGTANITVTTQDGSKTATCAVTINYVPVTKIIVHSGSSKTLDIGETGGLTANIVPGNATNKNVSWTSDNPAVATVSGSGLSVTVTAVAIGTTNITATTQDGNKTDTCTVTVK